MWGGDKLIKPKNISLLLSIVIAIIVFFLSQISAFIGYFLALFTLIMIIVAELMGSIWPTQTKEENVLVFSLFWGLLFGVLVPFIMSIFMDKGFGGIIDMLTK